MIFGLPWYAIIPLVAIIGGLISNYQTKKLKYAAKAKENLKEVEELRQAIDKLTKRIQNLEAIAVAEKSEEPEINLSDLEIKSEQEMERPSNKRVKN